MKNRYFVLLSFLFFYSISLIAQTPYAHYPLDGDATDVSGNSLHGTMVGAPVATDNRNGESAKAMFFPGGGDYIDLPEDFDFPNRTVILWFKVASVPSGNGSPFYNSDHGNISHGSTYILVYKVNGPNELHIGAGANNYDTVVDLNTWYQAAVVRSPSSTRLYVNGQVVAAWSNSSTVSSINGATTARIGTDRINGTFCDGDIDDVLIYNTALTDGQIAGNYTSLKDVHEIDSKLNVFVENGNITAQFSGNAELASEISAVTLTDITGRIISEKQGAYSGIMNEIKLPAGTYFVSVAVKNAPRLISRKVMVVE